MPLRQLFDEECRQAGAAGQLVAFAEIESSLYKRRRLAMPRLPTSPQNSDEAVSNSRFISLGQSPFYRGQVTDSNSDSALVFASDAQLQLLGNAHLIFVDSTFRVVPSLYYQLFTVFVQHVDYTFPVMYSLMTRKTKELYKAVLVKIHMLMPDFKPTQVIADYEEAPAAAIREVFGSDVTVSGCWFHYAQAVMKRLKKLGLTDAYKNEEDTQVTFRCLLALPLLPVVDISPAFNEIMSSVKPGLSSTNQLVQLCQYVGRQWINKSTVGASRLSVRDNASRTNNAVESFHSALRSRVKVAHPNLFTFLGHLQRTTTDNEADVERLNRGMAIRRAKKRVNLLNEARIKACISRYDGGTYTRMQFLRAVSHCVSGHAVSDADDNSNPDDDGDSDGQTGSGQSDVATVVQPLQNDLCEVCLITQREDRMALVPCGHKRFCASCIAQVEAQGRGCPICRTPISVVLRIF